MGIATSRLRMGVQIVVWDRIWVGKNAFSRFPLAHVRKSGNRFSEKDMRQSTKLER